MSDQNLLASAALFRALYDNNKDIYDVISEFVRAYILFNSKWTFNTTECVDGLKETFEFDLPEAVVSTCLKKRLKKSGELNIANGTYSITEKFNKENTIRSGYLESKSDYDNVLEKLFSHVKGLGLKSIEFSELENSFNKYFLNERLPNSHSSHIAQFLIENQDNQIFKEKVSRIEEGLILYAGIKSTPDLSTLGSWKGDLFVFLDTEHLFSAAGLNGELYKKIFYEFLDLVKDVNRRGGKGGRISLKYFEETANDFYNFFFAAESIIDKGKWVDPSKTAMISITNGCRWKSDVIEKKKIFEKDIERIGIKLEEKKDYYKNPEYNVESESVLEDLRNTFWSDNDNNRLSETLKIFTKINVFRKGESKGPIDCVKSIFLTENNRTKAIAFSDPIFPNNGSIPFATNIEFLTERIWFKLSKGFVENTGQRTSFDVITKAKLVLSSQLNRSVSENYKELNKKYEKGEIDKDNAALLISELRSRPNSPDEMTPSEAEDSIAFIDSDLIEGVQREKALLERKAQDGELAQNELRELRHKNHKDSLKSLKVRARYTYYILVITLSIVLFAAISIIVRFLYGDNDTILSISLGVLALILSVLSFSKIKYINKKLWRFSVRSYRSSLNKALQPTSR